MTISAQSHADQVHVGPLASTRSSLPLEEVDGVFGKLTTLVDCVRCLELAIILRDFMCDRMHMALIRTTQLGFHVTLHGNDVADTIGRIQN